MTDRRKLGTRGRIVTAGVSLGAAGLLVGGMAITDTTADATPATTVEGAGNSNPATAAPARGLDGSATPYTPSSGSSTPPPAPQPQTRTGGS